MDQDGGLIFAEVWYILSFWYRLVSAYSVFR